MMSNRVVIAEGRAPESDRAASKPEPPGPPGLISRAPIRFDGSVARARKSARSITFAPFAPGLSDGRSPTFIEPHSPPEHLRHEIFEALGIEVLIEDVLIEDVLIEDVLIEDVLVEDVLVEDVLVDETSSLEDSGAEPVAVLEPHPEATITRAIRALPQALARVRLIAL